MTEATTGIVLHDGASEVAPMRAQAEDNAYFGASLLRLSESESARLMEELPEDAHDILPTGEVYVSHVHYRRKLN